MSRHGPNSGDSIVVTIDQDVVERFRGGVAACAAGPVSVLRDVVPELADPKNAVQRFVEEGLHRTSDVQVSAF